MKYLFPSLLVGFVAIGAWIGFSRYTTKQELQSTYSSIPSIMLTSTDGDSVNLKTEGDSAPSVLIYFNSSCPICQSEAELIQSKFRKDTLTRFLWVSSESVEEVKNFAAHYSLDSLDTHRFYSDTLFRLASAFRLTGVPATFVYDDEGNLVDYALGAVSMSDLTLSIQKAHDRSR
ncbi:TlpA family protein disulfide reductase [Algoriphagus mannitolivorans]|uniref:TlpA family protein disulfide reductase n=1 Tax=Algoriphagus mannitolivorans TaxID=226504 RepID=UPI0024808D83|nr:TlpA disulfide reductase family protein [Algoriphagus mannitolivorans]